MIYPPHATDRRTVEARGTISNRTEEMETGGARTTAVAVTICCRRDTVGDADGRPVARYAPTISIVLDLLSEVALSRPSGSQHASACRFATCGAGCVGRGRGCRKQIVSDFCLSCLTAPQVRAVAARRCTTASLGVAVPETEPRSERRGVHRWDVHPGKGWWSVRRSQPWGDNNKAHGYRRRLRPSSLHLHR